MVITDEVCQPIITLPLISIKMRMTVGNSNKLVQVRHVEINIKWNKEAVRERKTATQKYRWKQWKNYNSQSTVMITTILQH